MPITIGIPCPRCHGVSVVRTEKSAMEYKIIDTLIADVNVVRITTLIKTVLVRGAGIQDTAAILGVSAGKVPKTPASSNYELKPRKTRYKNLETDEFWNKQEKEQTMVGLRVSSRFRRDSRRNCDAMTAGARLHTLGVTCDTLSTDDQDSFALAFGQEQRFVGTRYTVGI